MAWAHQHELTVVWYKKKEFFALDFHNALFTSDKFRMVYDERLQGVPMETIPLQGFDKSYSYQFEWISREERLFYANLNRLAKTW